MRMSWKRHHFFVLAVVLVSLGLVAWWALPGSAPEETPTRTPARNASTQTASSPRPELPELPTKTADGSRLWAPGMSYRYAVETDQEVTFSSSQPGAPVPPGMRFHIQGEWNVGIVSAGEARIEAQVRLVPASVSVNVDGKDALTPEVRQAMMASLTMPFFMTLERSGAARWVHFEMGTDVLAQGILRSVVAASQFVVTGVPQQSWQTDEYDVTGQYQASYQRLSGVKQFEKTKQAYTHVATSQGLQPYQAGTLRIDVSSRTTFGLAEDGWAETLQAQERLEVDAGQGMPRVSNQLQLRLRLLERTRDVSLLGALEARRASLSTMLLASYQAQTQDPKERYRRLLAGKHFNDLLNDLRSLPKTERERDDARSLALEQLRALFMLEPTEALKVPDTLRKGDLDPIAASPLLGALSAASTPEAIQALSKVVDDSSIGVPVRTDATAALGMADAPTQEGVNALRNLRRAPQPELRDTATLGLGNAAYQMQDENARGAEGVVRELETAYRSARTPEEQAILLRALGNTRDARALATIQSGLGSNSILVRQAAVEALRLIPEPTADRLLATQLLGDASPDVRKAALFAASFRPLEPLLPSLQQVLQRDPADAVRSEVVHLLGANLPKLPGARVLLSWSSQNDANPAIRQLATRFLDHVAENAHP
ncbi:HEAT repeat domain-containing protein [Archangium violaceum]|uniref:HEAT repeat domain-containing protein n=1 Tax=Archangium violaceum TaxID=83451 RepID=UPI0019512B42|nr:HEAT repeat domain-containing protein [Archangium violaceum]QRN93895.1 HEAT repeat domain-containing protein [Archangium violaceum]